MVTLTKKLHRVAVTLPQQASCGREVTLIRAVVQPPQQVKSDHATTSYSKVVAQPLQFDYVSILIT
jgi:hypothetical protein